MKSLGEMTAKQSKWKIPVISGVLLLILTQLLVLRPAVGAIVAAILGLLFVILLRPRLAYLLFIAFLPAEGFDAVPGASFAKLLGMLLTLGLTLRILLKKESFPKDDLFFFFFFFLVGGIPSFFHATDMGMSIKIYITYVFLVVFYLLTRYFLRSLEDLKTSFNVLIISNFIMVAGVYLFKPGLTISLTDRLTGGMGDPNEYASFVLVLIPFALYMAFESKGLKRVFYWASSGILFLLIILSFSRGGLIGLTGVLLTIIFYYGRKRIKQLVMMFAVITVITVPMIPQDFWMRASTIIHPAREETVYHGDSIEGRIDNYRAALKMFLDNPLAGVGIYNFRLYSVKYGGIPNVVHDMYLQILSGEGLAGFIPFLIILLLSWRKLRIRGSDDERLRNFVICLKASFVSILITSSFLSADHKKILWFLLAAISSAYALGHAHEELPDTAGSSAPSDSVTSNSAFFI